MGEQRTDIPIKYVNSTGDTDFSVVVFTKNFSTKTPNTFYCAWRVLRAQTADEFVYPVEMGVGASYEKNGQKIISGPFPAQLGTTWSINQASPTDTAVLQQEMGGSANPNNTIVIKNVPPSQWGGRKFDVGIYKDSRLVVIQKDVHVGNQIDFMLQPKLYFGVVRNMTVGETFTSLEITTGLQMFDLSRFPNGIEVTLSQSPDGGQYSFAATSLD